jgi:hypothetical protein
MAIGIYLGPACMHADKYDDVIKRRETASSGKSAGRLYTWVSAPATAFKYSMSGNPGTPLTRSVRTLMPIIQEVGVDPGSAND